MRVFSCDQFTYPLPPGHRFPAAKYVLLRERVEAELVPPCKLLMPDAASDEQLLRVHCPDYLTAVKNGTLTPREVRRIGLPWSPERDYRTPYGPDGAYQNRLQIDEQTGRPCPRRGPPWKRIPCDATQHTLLPQMPAGDSDMTLVDSRSHGSYNSIKSYELCDRGSGGGG